MLASNATHRTRAPESLIQGLSLIGSSCHSCHSCTMSCIQGGPLECSLTGHFLLPDAPVIKGLTQICACCGDSGVTGMCVDKTSWLSLSLSLVLNIWTRDTDMSVVRAAAVPDEHQQMGIRSRASRPTLLRVQHKVAPKQLITLLILSAPWKRRFDAHDHHNNSTTTFVLRTDT